MCTDVLSGTAEMTKHQVRMASRSDFTASFEAVLESMSLTASTTPFGKAVSRSLKGLESFR